MFRPALNSVRCFPYVCKVEPSAVRMVNTNYVELICFPKKVKGLRAATVLDMMALFSTPESPICIGRQSEVRHAKILYKILSTLCVIRNEGDGSEIEERLVSEKRVGGEGPPCLPSVINSSSLTSMA